jgi:primary-amine oxidase
MTRRLLPSLLVALTLLLVFPMKSLAQCSAPSLVEQPFPLAGPEETRWRICWQAQSKNGIVITAAFFRKSPSSPFVRVFWDARISEIFVPYHSGSPRFYDVTGFNFSPVTLNQTHCPAAAGGTLLGNPAKVCKEVRDRGLAWMNDGVARRGQEVALWGALDAANYNYVQMWIFRDDGIVEGRVGATARNLPGAELEAHMHNPIWRLDIDLNGFSGDSVSKGTHTENLPGGTATDTAPVIATASGLQWNAQQFTALHVHDSALKNAKGHASMFHLMPLRMGTGRHQEALTKNDFWVTRYDPAEMHAKDLPTYVATPESVANADIVLWYMGSVHHLVRDEDGEFVGNVFQGEAHLMWTGWVLKPHNLFDKTPLVGISKSPLLP